MNTYILKGTNFKTFLRENYEISLGCCYLFTKKNVEHGIEHNVLIVPGVHSEILKRGGAVSATMVAGKESFRFQWSKKAEITSEIISFWQNIYISIFKFSPFLLVKS